MKRHSRLTIRLILSAMIIAAAISFTFAEPAWAEQTQTATPKLYTAGAELGAYLDKELLKHKSEIVFHTKDLSLMESSSPTLETKLEYCSVMLYGIKHDKTVKVDYINAPHVVVISSPDGGSGAQVVMSDKSDTYYRVTIKPKYRYSKAKDRKFYKRIQSVAKKAKQKNGVRARARYINEYVTKRASYNIKTPYHNTAYSAVMKRKASCQGYADLFTIIARQADLKAETVCGHAWFRLNGKKSKRAYHAWNLVKNGKKWVQVDPTFNDLGDRTKYFMLGKKKFNKNHKLDKFYKTASWKKAHPMK